MINRRKQILFTFLSGIVLLMAAGISSSYAQKPVDFTGTWKTVARCKPVNVTMTQVGNQVTGTYSPGNGKIFDGVVTDNTLRFKWTQDGGEGLGEFTMSWDSKNFTGTSSQIKPPGFIIAWNTYTPPVTPFAGTWQTRMDGKNDVSLTMEQSGDQVMGLYQGNGKIEGTVSGRVLRFTWQSDRGTGSGRFVMEEKNSSFSGTYNRGSNPDDVDSTWSGKLPPGPEGRPGPCDPLGVVYGYPKPPRPETDERGRNMSEAELAKKQAEYEAAQKNAPATFAGTWRGKFGEQFLKLILRQAGAEVTGQFINSPAPAGVIREGIVDGNTLRFKVMRAGRVLPNGLTSPDEFVGSVELVMDEGGKSFKGTVFGTATSGTLIGR